MNNINNRPRAEKLRRQGLSIRFIAKELEVAPSTVSKWCKNLTFTKSQEIAIKRYADKVGMAGRMKGSQVNKARKEEQIKHYQTLGENVVGKLSDRDILIAGIALYWAEGNKKSEFALTNSDPAMIKFALRWFEILGIEKENLRPRVTINSIHAKRIKIVERFWAELLEIPQGQFRPPVLLKNVPKKLYSNHDSYYGILALQIRKGTECKYRVLGLIGALAKNIDS